MYIEKLYENIMSLIATYNRMTTEWNNEHHEVEDWHAWIIAQDAHTNPHTDH